MSKFKTSWENNNAEDVFGKKGIRKKIMVMIKEETRAKGEREGEGEGGRNYSATGINGRLEF